MNNAVYGYNFMIWINFKKFVFNSSLRPVYFGDLSIVTFTTFFPVNIVFKKKFQPLGKMFPFFVVCFVGTIDKRSSEI